MASNVPKMMKAMAGRTDERRFRSIKAPPRASVVKKFAVEVTCHELFL
jgi:hypothetical protein